MVDCDKLFAHSLTDPNMKTVEKDGGIIVRECKACGLIKRLPHSQRLTYFVNNNLIQTKKWAADDNRRELIQPIKPDGSINHDFTEVYGYNPLDPATKLALPDLQGGIS